MNIKVLQRKQFSWPSGRLVIAGLVLAALAVAAISIWQVFLPSSDVPLPDYWPTAGWRSSTPEAQGLDSDQLAGLLLSIRKKNIQVHSLLIIRNGYVVTDATFYPYDGQTPHNVASVTKSLMTTLIGIAADRGKLDLNDTMVSFFPDRPIANLDPRKESITVRHLASMSSGLDCTNEADESTLREMVASPDYVQFMLDRRVTWEPGKQFVYCSPAIHLLSPILQQATGMTTLDFARQYLFEPLGFGEVMWPQDPQGYYDGWADVSLHPHDMARLGLLFLHKGQWDGQQIVSRGWVEEATQVQVATPAEDVDPYGYGWWLVPDVEGVYRADGRGGQYIFVLPQWNMIVVTTGGGFEMDQIGEQILASISDSDEPLPANPEGVARLDAAIDAVVEPPEPGPVAPLPDIARSLSGKTYFFALNPVGLKTVRFEFNGSSEATGFIEFSGRPQVSVPVGLDGVFRFSAGPDGRPQVYRGSWTDPHTFLLEYDGITNNDHAFLQFSFEGDRVDVGLQETAHEMGIQLVGRLQQP